MRFEAQTITIRDQYYIFHPLPAMVGVQVDRATHRLGAPCLDIQRTCFHVARAGGGHLSTGMCGTGARGGEDC